MLAKTMFELPEEIKQIRSAVKKFAEAEIKPVCDEYHRKGEFPFELIKKAGSLGYLAAFIPEEYGGPGAGVLADNVIKEEIAKVDPAFAMAFMTHLGTEAILFFGNKEQKETYLPGVAEGKKIFAFAQTEEQGGSDVASIRTSAKKQGNSYVINGSKLFITNAAIADFFVVLARTSPERHKGLTMFIVDSHADGVEARKMDIIPGFSLSQTGEVLFNNVIVPEENLLGELNRGFYQAMRWLDRTRTLIGSFCLGTAEGAFNLGYNYAKERTLFGKKLFQFEDIRFRLSYLAAELEAAKLSIYRASALEEKGEPDTKLASMAKVFASKLAEEAASLTFTLHGGYGASMEYPIYKFWNSAKISQIIEGATEIHKEIIAKRLDTF